MLACSKGAIYAITGSSFAVTSSRFQNNTSSSGGAVTLMGCGAKAKTSTIVQSVFSGNEAVTGNGGAVRSQSCPALAMSDVTFDNNVAKQVRPLKISVMHCCRCHLSDSNNPQSCLDAGRRCSVHVELRVNGRYTHTLYVHRKQRGSR